MTRRHELDPISLTFGFAFTGLGLLFLLGRADQTLRLQWVWPLLLLVLGAGILFDVTRSRQRPDPEVAPIDPDATDELEPVPEVGAEPKVGVGAEPEVEPETEVESEPGVEPEAEVEPEVRPDPDAEPAVDNREYRN